MDLDDPDPEPRICIALPEALVELALRGEWSDFVLLRRWHTHALSDRYFLIGSLRIGGQMQCPSPLQ